MAESSYVGRWDIIGRGGGGGGKTYLKNVKCCREPKIMAASTL